ncbi:MAG: helix-turn-helix domain-containing protein [Deltaproteobacteria bacterium]
MGFSHHRSNQQKPGRLGQERAAIVQALEQSRWNKSRAASLLGVSRRSLFRRMQKFGL